MLTDSSPLLSRGLARRNADVLTCVLERAQKIVAGASVSFRAATMRHRGDAKGTKELCVLCVLAVKLCPRCRFRCMDGCPHIFPTARTGDPGHRMPPTFTPRPTFHGRLPARCRFSRTPEIDNSPDASNCPFLSISRRAVAATGFPLLLLYHRPNQPSSLVVLCPQFDAPRFVRESWGLVPKL